MMRQRRAGRRALAAIALAAMLVLAGCSGGQGTTTEPPGTGPGTDSGTTPELQPADVSASAVKSDVLSALRRVDEYLVRGTIDQTISGNNQQQQFTANATRRFDTSSQAFRIETTVTRAGRTVTVLQYLKDGVYYQRSPGNLRRFSSKWIKFDTGGNTSRVFRLKHELGRVRAGLANGSVSVAGRTRLDGTEVYVLRVDVNETAIRQYALGPRMSEELADSLTVKNEELRLYVSTESGRPLRIERDTTVTSIQRGQKVRTEVSTDFRVQYGDVSITLPEGASTAVNITDRIR